MKNLVCEHRATREFLCPLALDTLEFRLFTETCVKDVILHYFKRNTLDFRKRSMTCDLSTCERKLWESVIVFPEQVHYIKYYFELETESGARLFLNEIGLSKDVPSDGFFEFLCAGSMDSLVVPSWAEGIVFYQIFPDSFASVDQKRRTDMHPWDSVPDSRYFGGNLKGIESKIPYLKDLGVGCIYLNPVFKAEFNHKYATIDYFEIDEGFGTKEDFRSLVESLHSAGIRIVLDGVFNHTSTRFHAFEDVVRNGRLSKYVDWFYFDSFPVSQDPLNYMCVGDYCHMPKLNTGNLEVQAFILSVMEYWIEEFGIDGWRLDVADEVEPLCWSFVRRTLKSKYPSALLLGECWSDAYRIVGDGNQLDISMNYLFRNACLGFFAKNGSAHRFAEDISNLLVRYHKRTNKANFNLLGSHDTERFLTSCGMDEDRLRLAIAFQMFFIGSPSIYYGDEVGMHGGNDPLCRAGMRWCDANSKLHDYVRGLVRFRNESEIVKHGDFRQLYVSESQSLYIFIRFNATDCIGFAFNSSNEDQIVDDSSVLDYFGISSLKINRKSYQILHRNTGGMK